MVEYPEGHLLDALEGRMPSKVPFVPAIYEHKASFVNATPSDVARDARLLTDAVLAEHELVRADAVVVGIDVYNVEAEAVGSEIVFFDDTSIPAATHDGAALPADRPVRSLTLPDPARSGRMPIHLEAARNVQRKIGRMIPVRGAVSGPFSMAAHIAGPVNLFMMTLSDPGRVHELLQFSVRVGLAYGSAFIEAGCGVVVFDSQSSPDLLSPAMYREFILEPTKSLISALKREGLRHVPLVIGGNTTGILGAMCETGANNILCDAPADASLFLAECSKRRIAFRRNIDTTGFLSTTPEAVGQTAEQYIRESAGYPGFILGTGVVPYGTPLACLRAVRDAADRARRPERMPSS